VNDLHRCLFILCGSQMVSTQSQGRDSSVRFPKRSKNLSKNLRRYPRRNMRGTVLVLA
jgi:hypothetical protein